MNKKALIILLLITLFVTTFAVIVKPAHATSYPVYFTNAPPWNSLYNAINSGLLIAGDHVHILAGQVETLPAPLVIGIPNLFIYGAPTGATPSIDLGGQTISITAPNVLIYGLDFWDSTGMSPFCIDLTPATSGSTIRNCTIRGSFAPGSSAIMTSNSPNNLIAANDIANWVYGISVWGPGSIGNLIKLNKITYNTALPFTAYGVLVGGGAGLGTPNRICWNNIFAFPSPPGLGQELWDPTPGNPPNLFDDIGLLPDSFSKGNYVSSWAIPPPYPVAGPGGNGWFDRAPLVGPMSTLWGDVDLDGRVDIFDAILLAGAFGRYWCDARWDSGVNLCLVPEAPNPGGPPPPGRQTIDILDAIVVAGSFGTSY